MSVISTLLLACCHPALAQRPPGGEPPKQAHPEKSQIGHVEYLNLPHVEFWDMDIAGSTEIWRLRLRASLIGVEVRRASDTLRAQLALPEDQGVVVTKVIDGGPAHQAGLERHDVLLTMARKPVADADALNKLAKESGEKPVPVVLLRRGKKLTIDVTPKKQEPSGLEILASRWIGVSVAEADETLRAQLRLPEKRGLVVTSVEPKSPSAKANMKLHDVLVEFGGKPLTTVDDLRSQINEVGEKPARMKLLRGGEFISVQVTPAAHPPGITDLLITSDGDGAYDVEIVQVEGDLVGHVRLTARQPQKPQQQLSDLIQQAKDAIKPLDKGEDLVDLADYLQQQLSAAV